MPRSKPSPKELTAICEICGFDKLGKFSSDAKGPITGAMFTPVNDRYGQPFPPSVDWRWIRCPMCSKRPFIYEDKIMTTNGYFKLKGN